VVTARQTQSSSSSSSSSLSSASKSSSNLNGNNRNHSVVYIWEEEIPPSTALESTTTTTKTLSQQQQQQRRRKLISTEKSQMLGSPLEALLGGRKSSHQWSSLPSDTPPHRLRTDRWHIHVQWRGVMKKRTRSNENGTSSSRNLAKQVLELEFSDNGYVRCWWPDHTTSSRGSDDNSNASSSTTNVTIGKWELASQGLTWNLPLLSNHHRKHHPMMLVFHGDLVLNPFGEQPKLIRGVILPDDDNKSTGSTKRWFRPVLGTFTGAGIGKDTADLSYSHRKSII
jgi:hypothetical protein